MVFVGVLLTLSLDFHWVELLWLDSICEIVLLCNLLGSKCDELVVVICIFTHILFISLLFLIGDPETSKHVVIFLYLSQQRIYLVNPTIWSNYCWLVFYFVLVQHRHLSEWNVVFLNFVVVLLEARSNFFIFKLVLTHIYDTLRFLSTYLGLSSFFSKNQLVKFMEAVASLLWKTPSGYRFLRSIVRRVSWIDMLVEIDHHGGLLRWLLDHLFELIMLLLELRHNETSALQMVWYPLWLAVACFAQRVGHLCLLLIGLVVPVHGLDPNDWQVSRLWFTCNDLWWTLC